MAKKPVPSKPVKSTPAPVADLPAQQARTTKLAEFDARVHDTAKYVLRNLVDIWGATAVQGWLDDLR